MDMSWAIEKTAGTLSIINEIKGNSGEADRTFEKFMNYSGALIVVEINDFFLIKSLTNFGVLYHPQGLAWSDIMNKTNDIYSVSTQETIGIPIRIDYGITAYPFVGYSYLKLDYKNDYEFLPRNFYGHTIYHDFLFGVEHRFYLKKWFQMDIKGMFTPFSYYYPLQNIYSFCFEWGVDLFFEYEYFGLHLYVSRRNTLEKGDYYERYFSSIGDIGITFRIGAKRSDQRGAKLAQRGL